MNRTLTIGIGFSPYGNSYGRYGADVFAQLKQQGYGGADINAANTDTTLYTKSEEALRPQLTAARQAAEQAGVTISQVHGPWRWPPRDGSVEERAERLEKMKRAVVITALLGCRHLVIHPLMPYGIEDTLSGHQQATWDVNVAFLKDLTAFAKTQGVVICVENMPMPLFSLATPQRVLELVEAIHDPNLSICLDTGHVAVFPHLSVGEEIRRLGDHLRVFHLHDNHGEEDSHLYPMDGIIDWGAVRQALEAIGYQGVLSLETAPSGGLEEDAFVRESRRLNRRMQDWLG